MCVAIVSKPGAKLSDAVLQACFENNRDGAGFAYVNESGKVAVEKGFFDFGEFLAAFRPVEERVKPTGPMLVHFRISTGGGRTKENCHPYLFKHGALIHNGFFFPAVGEESDTRMLTRVVGDKLAKGPVRIHKAALEQAFGQHNKVAVLYADRSVEILNEKTGEWIEDNWFSNTFWKWRMGGGTPRPAAHGAACGVPTHRADGVRIPTAARRALTAADQQWHGGMSGYDYID
jgi:hypothetical protein